MCLCSHLLQFYPVPCGSFTSHEIFILVFYTSYHLSPSLSFLSCGIFILSILYFLPSTTILVILIKYFIAIFCGFYIISTIILDNISMHLNNWIIFSPILPVHLLSTSHILDHTIILRCPSSEVLNANNAHVH